MIPSKLIINNTEVLDTASIAKAFNTYFANIGYKLANEILQQMFHPLTICHHFLKL